MGGEGGGAERKPATAAWRKRQRGRTKKHGQTETLKKQEGKR